LTHNLSIVPLLCKLYKQTAYPEKQKDKLMGRERDNNLLTLVAVAVCTIFSCTLPQ